MGNNQYLCGGGLFGGGAIVTKPAHEMGTSWNLERSTKFQPKGEAVPYALRSCSGGPNQTWYVVEK